MKQYIRKADIILFIVLVAAGLAASAVLSMSHTAAGSDAKVVIESGGSLYATYPLSEDRTVVVPAPKQLHAEAKQDASGDTADDSGSEARDASSGYDYYNVVSISGGSVSVSASSCKNQVCVRHGSITLTGESIVCLPNRLVVRIEDGKGGGYDSITS